MRITPHAALAAFAVGLVAGTVPAHAALAVGAQAPLFVTQGAHAGKIFSFRLDAALRKGPVVLYFYPKAFTSGCTMEAHAFAEAMPQFAQAGATVIGLSADGIDQIRKFSVEECRKAFPIAIASPAIIRDYDVSLGIVGIGTGLANRTTYVIGRDGRIALAFSEMDWRGHVPHALAAVRALSAR